MNAVMAEPRSRLCTRHEHGFDAPQCRAAGMTGGAHHCPACGVALPAMARHPWYICALCRERITDEEGYLLEFGNTSLTDGFAWRRAGDADFQVALGFLGLLDGRPVRVTAARFGGIVAEPFAAPDTGFGPIEEKLEDDRPPGRPPPSK